MSKRIKEVYTKPEDVAHLWANQIQDHARTRNFYYNKEVIYSYGNHFPIARIYTDNEGKKTCFFTLRTYSSTTSKHIWVVRRANHLPVLYMQNVIEGDISYKDQHKKNVKHWEYELKEQFKKLEKARKREIYINKIQEIVGELRKYIEFFQVEADESLQKLIKDSSPENFQEYLSKEAERIKAETEKLNKESQARQKKSVTNWRKGKISRPYIVDNWDLLKINKETGRIETSQRVEIPEKTARSFYRHIHKVINKGGCDNDCKGEFMNAYQIKQINKKFIHIGCHKISMVEVEKIAKTLKFEK